MTAKKDLLAETGHRSFERRSYDSVAELISGMDLVPEDITHYRVSSRREDEAVLDLIHLLRPGFYAQLVIKTGIDSDQLDQFTVETIPLSRLTAIRRAWTRYGSKTLQDVILDFDAHEPIHLVLPDDVIGKRSAQSLSEFAEAVEAATRLNGG